MPNAQSKYPSFHFRSYKNVESCPLCDAVSMAPRLPLDVFECAACKLHFRNPRPSDDAIAAAYNLGETYSGWQQEESVRDYLWLKRLKMLRRHAVALTLHNNACHLRYHLHSLRQATTHCKIRNGSR